MPAVVRCWLVRVGMALRVGLVWMAMGWLVARVGMGGCFLVMVVTVVTAALVWMGWRVMPMLVLAESGVLAVQVGGGLVAVVLVVLAVLAGWDMTRMLGGLVVMAAMAVPVVSAVPVVLAGRGACS